MSKLVTAAIIGQAVGLLGWIDPIFIPLILAGPLITGAVAATRGLPAAWPAVLWFSAGINMLWTDWVVNREDVAFHAVVSVLVTLLALAGWGVVRLATRRRRVVA
jgi:hypothetical protein